MKLERLVGERFKERPSECVVDSHALMLRGGYMKYVANGIFSAYTPLKRVTRKIEAILREEMDAIDGQEVQFPVVMPASLWQESGRYESIGKELMRFADRNNSPLVLGMTHEEAAVQLVREYGQSHSKYPFMVYQIQTKFRDEARPRAGLIRVREFTMKDAYSFHLSQADLESYYARCYQAYQRIYARVGLSQVVAVASDSGMMGGSLSHEFMLLTPVGEDSIAICPHCGYSANVEAAEAIVSSAKNGAAKALTPVHTPGAQTIEAVCGFVGADKKNACKAVVYQQNSDDQYVVLFIRGDLEANETKITNHLKTDIRPALITQESGLVAGYIGPHDLKADVIALYDRSLLGAQDLVCGANQAEYHYTGFCMARDAADAVYHDFAKISDGGICPHCQKEGITLSRGIEVGNIFQLGAKYTQAMHMTYTAPDGSLRHPVMGCYGIGVGRLAAAVAEAHHDAFGPIWPMAIAPWQVHLCAVRPDDEKVRAYADELYAQLQKSGAEVIYDDRPVSAGVKFSDADLLGVPLRVIVSPRGLRESQIEIVSRDKKISQMLSAEDALAQILRMIASFDQ